MDLIYNIIIKTWNRKLIKGIKINIQGREMKSKVIFRNINNKM